MQILLTGGTGFIGRHLAQALTERGDQVSVVSRNPGSVQGLPKGCLAVAWLPDLSDYDAVINLAGEPLIGKRWNQAQRQRILASRIESTERIVNGFAEASPRPRVLVNASAIGIYGDRQDVWLDEQATPSTDFVGQVCTQWESAAQTAQEHDVRTTCIRIGLVLGMGGGALQKMLLPFKLGLGGPLGSGKQWMSWIHLDDLCRLFLHALDNGSVTGPYNGTAPNPVTNKQFTKTLGKVLKRPAFLPAPKFVLRAALGEVSQLLTDSQRCKADKSLASGFNFHHPNLEPALRDLLHE
jgi:uncharacterized protein (TIGR01777 family)